MQAAVEKWIEGLPLSDGRPFRLRGDQRQLLRGILRDDVTTAAYSAPRGSGKTTLIGALATAAIHPDGPLFKPDAESVIVAASLRQGSIGFSDVLRWMRPVIEDSPTDWTLNQSSQRKAILHKPTGASLQVISSEARYAMGLRLGGVVLLDEVAQWEKPQLMLDAIFQSAGKLPSKIVAISTRPDGADHPFEKLLRGGADFSMALAAKPDADPLSWAAVRQAYPFINQPAYGELRAALKRERRQVKADASLLPAWRCYRLNSGVAGELEALVLDADSWRRCERAADDLPQPAGPMVLGFDASESYAMTGVCSYHPNTGLLRGFAAFPREPGLEALEKRDGVHAERLYRRMAEAGELVTAGARAIDLEEVARIALARYGPADVVVMDSWRAKTLLDGLEAAGYPACDVVARRNGPHDGSEDLDHFRRVAIDGGLRVHESLLFRSALAGARVRRDANGNASLAKGSQGGRRASHKDDVLLAAVLAIAEGQRRLAAPKPQLWSVAV